MHRGKHVDVACYYTNTDKETLFSGKAVYEQILTANCMHGHEFWMSKNRPSELNVFV